MATCHWRFEESDYRVQQRFHEHHGENIALLDSRRAALRRLSFEKSVVFSELPLRPFELFLVAIEREERGWSGHLRLGITRIDPNRRPSLGEMSQELQTNSWITAISRALVQPCKNLATDVGSLVGVYYEPSIKNNLARLHLVVNGDDLCPPCEEIPIDQPLYAVIDVYACTKQVRIVPVVRTVERLSDLCLQQLTKWICLDTKQIPHRLRSMFPPVSPAFSSPIISAWNYTYHQPRPVSVP